MGPEGKLYCKKIKFEEKGDLKNALIDAHYSKEISECNYLQLFITLFLNLTHFI